MFLEVVLFGVIMVHIYLLLKEEILCRSMSSY